MKLLFFATMITASMLSCKKETLAPTSNINDMTDSSAVLLLRGDFMSGPYGTTSGIAKVYRQGNNYEIKLDSFSVSNGPDLHVYISKEAMPVNFIDLGAIRSTNGNQIYPVTGMPGFSTYKFIVIHCVAFNHLFGSARLNP